MRIVHEIFELSRDFYKELSNPISKNERETVIKKINEFLEHRENLLKEMKGPYTPEEQQMGEQLIEYNEKILSLLQQIKLDIQKDFLTAKNTKKNAPKYINPYTNVFNEGAYYDKKN